MRDFDNFTEIPKNVGNLGKIIVATGFEKLPKVQSGHTGSRVRLYIFVFSF